MKLESRDFREVGEGLPPGGRVRVNHWCGEGRTLVVSRHDRGISGHCFRCNTSGFIPASLSLHERIARLAEARSADALMQGQVELPTGETNPSLWPLHARVWVYKAGLNNDELQRLGFRYSDRSDRVIMPVLNDDKYIVFWQARGFSDAVPKYIAPAVDRSNIVAKHGVGKGELLVLTEDILSAIKVGRQCEAWCIMGTSLPDPIIMQIVNRDRPVLIGLDPDAAGRRGAGKVRKTLAALGIKVLVSYMERDPKLHSNQEISLWLSRASSQLLP